MSDFAEWQPQPGDFADRYKNRTPWMVDMSNPDNPNPRIWMGKKGGFHPLIDAVGLSPGYTVKGSIDHSTDPPTFSHFYGEGHPHGDTAIKHAERHFYQREDKPEDRRVSNWDEWLAPDYVHEEQADDYHKFLWHPHKGIHSWQDEAGEGAASGPDFYPSHSDMEDVLGWKRPLEQSQSVAGIVTVRPDQVNIGTHRMLGYNPDQVKADAVEHFKNMYPSRPITWTDGYYNEWFGNHGMDGTDPQHNTERIAGKNTGTSNCVYGCGETADNWVQMPPDKHHPISWLAGMCDRHYILHSVGMPTKLPKKVRKMFKDTVPAPTREQAPDLYAEGWAPGEPLHTQNIQDHKDRWPQWQAKVAGDEWEPNVDYDHFWENRRPFTVDPKSGDVWMGKQGEHHDAHPEAYNVGGRAGLSNIYALGDVYQGQVNMYDPIDIDLEPLVKAFWEKHYSDDDSGGPVPPHYRKEADADSWSAPAMTTTFENVGTGESDMNDNKPEHAHPSDNWVYIDGHVQFGSDHSDTARQLGHSLGLDPTSVAYISNLVARNTVPNDKQVAVGTMMGDYPQIWLSTVDRNHVWDTVMTTRQTGDPGSNDMAPSREARTVSAGWPERPEEVHHRTGAEPHEEGWQHRRPYVYDAKHHVMHWGDPGAWHSGIENAMCYWYPNHGMQPPDMNEKVRGAIQTNPHNSEQRFHTVWNQYGSDDIQEVRQRYTDGLGEWLGLAPHPAYDPETFHDAELNGYTDWNDYILDMNDDGDQDWNERLGAAGDTYTMPSTELGLHTMPAFNHRRPYIYYPNEDVMYWGGPGHIHDDLQSYAQNHMNTIHPQNDDGEEWLYDDPRPRVFGSLYEHPDTGQQIHEVHRAQWPNAYRVHGPGDAGYHEITPEGAKVLSDRVGVPVYTQQQQVAPDDFLEDIDWDAHLGHLASDSQEPISRFVTAWEGIGQGEGIAGPQNGVQGVLGAYTAAGSPQLLMAKRLANRTAHQKRSLKGFWPRLAADVAQLAAKAREQLMQREDILKLKETNVGEPLSQTDQVSGQNDWWRLNLILDGTPDEGFKLMPWIVREYKRGLKQQFAEDGTPWPDRAGIGKFNRRHAQDIIDQAVKLFVWSNEHNKPLPDYMNKQFDFAQLEQWVYQMNESGVVHGDTIEWQDSQVVHKFENGWHIDKVGPQDLGQEGELMGHCVGGYCNTVEHGDSTIYSLRDSKGEPHVTIEVRGEHNTLNPPENRRDRSFDIVQEQGKSNQTPIPEYKAMVDEWYTHLSEEHGYDIGEDDQAWYDDPEVEYNPPDRVYPNTLAGAQDYHEAVMTRDNYLENDEEGEVQYDHRGRPQVWLYQTPNHIQGRGNANDLAEMQPIILQAITAANSGVDPRHLAQVLYTTAHHFGSYGREGAALVFFMHTQAEKWKAERRQQDAGPQSQLFDTGPAEFPGVDNLVKWVEAYESTAANTNVDNFKPVPGGVQSHHHMSYPHVPGGDQYPNNTMAGRYDWNTKQTGPNWFEQLEMQPHFQMPGPGVQYRPSTGDFWPYTSYTSHEHAAFNNKQKGQGYVADIKADAIPVSHAIDPTQAYDTLEFGTPSVGQWYPRTPQDEDAVRVALLREKMEHDKMQWRNERMHSAHSTDWAFDVRNEPPDCPLCGHQLEIHFEGGASCPRCKSQFELGHNDEVLPSDDGVAQMAKEQWPDTLPWGEAEQDYYRTAMAEQTGDQELDYLIEQFKQQNETSIEQWTGDEEGYAPLDQMKTQQGARGWCSVLASDFAEFLNQHGIEAWHSSEDDRPDDPNRHDYLPDELGYADRPVNEPDQQHHCVTMIEHNGQQFMVDWTAAQYGYTEFPMVQRMDGQQWQREWTSKTAWSMPGNADIPEDEWAIGNTEVDGRPDRYPWVATKDGQVWFGPEGGSHQMISRKWFGVNTFQQIPDRVAVGELIANDQGYPPYSHTFMGADVHDAVREAWEAGTNRMDGQYRLGNVDDLVEKVRGALTPDLLHPKYRDNPRAHCYVATEALYHLLGGKDSGWTPTRMRTPDDGVHWFLRGADGQIVDATADQFDVPPDYSQGRGSGFLTAVPSKRTQTVMQRVGMTAIAMPFDTNTFYHVTDKSRIPSIAQKGLVGRSEYTNESPVWHEFPVDPDGVYLHPNVSNALAYSKMNRWENPVITRVTGVDQNKLGPDHEHFYDQYMGQYPEAAEFLDDNERYGDEEAEGDVDDNVRLWRRVKPYVDAYEQQNPDYYQDADQWYTHDDKEKGKHFVHSLAVLADMPPDLRYEVARHHADNQGHPIMHYGPIHPRHIEFAQPHLLGESFDEDHTDRFYDEHPEWARGPDPEDDDDEWHDDHDYALDQWMGEQPFINAEDVDWHGEDPQNDDLTHQIGWQPLHPQWQAKTANTTVYRGSAHVISPQEVHDPASFMSEWGRGLWTTDFDNAKYYASHERDYVAEYEQENSSHFYVAQVIYEGVANQAGFQPNPDRSLDDQNNEYLIQDGVTPTKAHVELVEYADDDDNNDAWGNSFGQATEVGSRTYTFVNQNGQWVLGV